MSSSTYTHLIDLFKRQLKDVAEFDGDETSTMEVITHTLQYVGFKGVCDEYDQMKVAMAKAAASGANGSSTVASIAEASMIGSTPLSVEVVTGASAAAAAAAAAAAGRKPKVVAKKPSGKKSLVPETEGQEGGEAAEESKKKKRVTAYNVYVACQVKKGCNMKDASATWKQLSEDDKQEYVKMAEVQNGAE
jgi:hypothetical protein